MKRLAPWERRWWTSRAGGNVITLPACPSRVLADVETTYARAESTLVEPIYSVATIG
jgi:hypothetical protein